MDEIAVYGAGGLGKEVACLINAINDNFFRWKLIGFFDDGIPKGYNVSHYGTVMGGIDELNSWKERLAVVISIGSPAVVNRIVEMIKNKNVYFPNLIHPCIRISDKETFKIGRGNIIKHDCGFSCDVSIGDFNLFNGGVVLGHDIIIGSYNVFMPDVRISGETVIGDNNFFGVGAISLQRIVIGDGVKLGAASVLMRSPRRKLGSASFFLRSAR